MRFCELASRVFALGIAMGPATSAAMAGTGSDDPPIPLTERVFFDRSALLPDIGGLFAPDAPRIVALPDGSPQGGAAEPVAAKGSRGAIVLAALAPSKGGTLTDVGPHLLPWSVPAVPPLLSTSAKSAPHEVKLPVIEDPSVRALQQALATRPANRPDRAPASRKKPERAESARRSRDSGRSTHVRSVDRSPRLHLTARRRRRA